MLTAGENGIEFTRNSLVCLFVNVSVRACGSRITENRNKFRIKSVAVIANENPDVDYIKGYCKTSIQHISLSRRLFVKRMLFKPMFGISISFLSK